MITSCRDCIFNISDEENVQYGCDFTENRLEKLAENGAELEVVKEDDRQFFHIHNRFCNACCHPDSIADTPRVKWKETIKDLTSARVAMVIYAGQNSTLEDVHKSLDSVLNQIDLPYCVYVMIDNDSIDRHDIDSRLRLAQGLLFFKVEKVLDDSWGFEKSVHYVLDKTAAMYFTSCNAGYEYPIDFIERIDKAINEDMKQIIVILPDENNNGLFVQHKLYKDVIGSEGFPFVENLMYLAKAYKQEEFILKELP